MKGLVIVIVIGMLVTACVGRPADDATGQEIYLQLCSNCHGDDLGGALGPGLGAGTDAAREPDEFLRITITDGRGRMPSFKSSLSDAQVELLIGYMREEQGT
jgi:mono/diheme cytochrome c family protein